MHTNHVKYLFFLGLVMNLSSIHFHLRGKSTLPLLYDVKLTNITHCTPIIMYQSSHKNSESNSEKKIKVVGIFFFAKNIRDTWLTFNDIVVVLYWWKYSIRTN